MKQLERLVGTWNGTAEMVSPTREEMIEYMPEMADKMPEYFKGGSTWSLTFDGLVLKVEGWHEMTKDERANYVEFIKWDSKKERFLTFFFSDYGEHATGELKVDRNDPDLFHMKGTGVDAQGTKKRFKGTMRFVDNDTVFWEVTESSGFQKMKMKMKGTMRKG